MDKEEADNIAFIDKAAKVIRVTIDPANNNVISDIPDYSAHELLHCIKSLLRTLNSLSHLTGLKALIIVDEGGMMTLPPAVAMALGQDGAIALKTCLDNIPHLRA